MRRFVFLFLVFAACGEGGPAVIPKLETAELAGLFGPRYELAYVRLGERPRAGVGAADVSVSLNSIAVRCDRICRTAGQCIGTGDVRRCIDRCFETTADGPVACALPTLDAITCAVDAICRLPIDQRGRTGERLLACGVEFGEIAAVQPGLISSADACELPDF